MGKKSLPRDAFDDRSPRLPTAGTEDAVTKHEERTRRRASLRRVPVLKLEPHPRQPRDRHAPENVSELMMSIETHGLLQPPLISQRRDGSKVILAGHRRTKSCQLLTLEGRLDAKIPAYVVAGLTEEEELDFILAEQLHRDDAYSAVALAESIGDKWAARERSLGRSISIRDLADCIPSAQKTAVAEYMTIYKALGDPRLEPLVRQADKAGKSLLYRALRLDDFRTKHVALAAFEEGGTAAMRKALKNSVSRTGPGAGGRPRSPTTRRKRGEGYDLTVRFRPGMAAEAALVALADVEALAAELRPLAHGGAVDGVDREPAAPGAEPSRVR